MTQENKEVKRLLDWAVSNEWAWDLVWGPGIDNYTFIECLNVMQDLIDNEFYQVAVILLVKLLREMRIKEIIGKLAIKRICGCENSSDFLTQCIVDLKNYCIDNNSLNERISN